MNQIILMYHDITSRDNKKSGFQNPTALKYKVEEETFENQVKTIFDYITQRGFQQDSVVFTFDDGGVSALTVAAPILEKYGFKGYFFVATKYIGTSLFLNKDQIRELVNRGHIVGAHSHSHPSRMDILPINELEYEWKTSQTILQEILGNAPDVASIPNGFISPKGLDIIASYGIKHIHTSRPTLNHWISNNAKCYGRFAISKEDTANSVVAIVSSRGARARIILRYKLISAAKFLLGNTYLKIRRFLLRKS